MSNIDLLKPSLASLDLERVPKAFLSAKRQKRGFPIFKPEVLKALGHSGKWVAKNYFPILSISTFSALGRFKNVFQNIF